MPKSLQIRVLVRQSGYRFEVRLEFEAVNMLPVPDLIIDIIM
jgi:hypothetical protein